LLLRTLGTVELRNGEAGTPAPVLGLGKPLALLIYLSAAPGRSASRSLLISLLWSDLETDAAKHALRQTLWYLRRKTGRDVIAAAGDTLQLLPEVEVDRDLLLAASAEGRHEEVVSRYVGPFVPEFATPGGSGFEEWCALERRRLLQVFRHAAESIITAELSRGHARAALDLARRLRDQDRYDEGGWRLLLEVCASANDALATRAEAEALVQLAEREELQLEPATRALLRVARASGPDSGKGTASGTRALQSDALVGREQAFAQLLGAWEQVRAGAIRRVHVTARAGLGKTRLLRDFEARLRAMRGRVVSVGGTYGGRDMSFGVAGDLAAALAQLPGKRAIAPASAATLIGLNPSLSTYFDDAPRIATPDDALRERSLAVRELATAVAFEHPVAILIDDLHWVDDASAALIGALADGLRDVRILLVTTGRKEARQVAVASHAETLHVTLDPLTAPQVEELVLGIAALPAESWAAEFSVELWRAARGSPLLALETLQLMEDRGELRRADGGWCADHPQALLAELRAGDALRGRLEDMERTDRWLLTLLAAAGAPVDDETLVEASERPSTEVLARLRGLETRALTVRSGDGWQVAHDEIADEIVRVASADGLALASARLGRAMLATGAWDERRARRGARLLRSSGDDAARGELFRRFAAQRFALGDRRGLDALAADLFGPSVRDGELRAIRRSAPLSWRVGLMTPMRQALAAAAAVALLIVGALVVTRDEALPPPDAVLGLALVDSAGRVTFQQVELREDAWSPLQPLATAAWDGMESFTLVSTNAFEVALHPNQRQLVTSESTEEPGGIDLFVRERGAPAKRLLSAGGDDGTARISPDGSRLVFATSRWDSLMHYDLALSPMSGGPVTPLTSGPSTDHNAVWSPSATQIAFSRHNWGVVPNELCVVQLEGSRTVACRHVDDADEAFPTAWIDEDRILAVVFKENRRRLVALQWSTGETIAITDGPASSYHVSPDAHWAYCVCAIAADGRQRPAVFPLLSPSFVRALQLPEALASASVHPFWISSEASVGAARLRIQGPSRVPVGVPSRLRATLTDAHDREIRYPGSVRWTLADPSAGTIDSISGLLMLNGRAPQAVVRAASGRSARDSLLIRVAPATTQPRFVEEWTDTSMSRWSRFGRPSPSTSRAADGSAVMRNNGEGSFESGALSRDEFDPSLGLAVDLRVSTRVTMSQWQAMQLGVFSGLDVARYERAKDRNVSPFVPPQALLCNVGYPIEGMRLGDLPIFTLTSHETVRVPIPNRSLLRGAWYTIRLQYLPDGRCALAIDGVPLAITASGRQTPGRARVRVSGNMYQTEMLAGRLQVFEGVPADIDWSKAQLMQR